MHSKTKIPPKPPSRVIAKRVALGFGLVSVVSVVMCGMLISLLGSVSQLVDEMHENDVATSHGLALATSIREQYIHQAHWIIERDDEHLHHYKNWPKQVRSRVDALRPLYPEHTEILEEIRRDSEELDRIFEKEIRPAVLRSDVEEVVRLHAIADSVSQRATRAADLVARSIDDKMAQAHVLATRTTTIGLSAGVFCIVLVIAISIWFTFRLRQSVLHPLQVLSAAARRFGEGDFKSRVGQVGEGELLAVASAFDGMADELEARELRIIQGERMAAIGQLAAGVAHEINNPIQVIRGYLKTMTPDSSPETLNEELQILDEEAAACQRIADDLLMYSRLPALKIRNFQLDDFLHETVRRFRETSEGEGRTIEVEAEMVAVNSDPDRLRQVLFNLLANAAQVSKSSSSIEVKGVQDRGEETYVITVADEGVGISPEDKDRVFEPFFSKRSGGTGLGLAVSQGIVQAHGGSISVRDREAGGTMFRVELPRENS
ncbi:MAG: HAMP domain-containing protein [Kofleriaceae bacterium]|nr:HAMP domain-containing protein [Kofleriaceae bacterium]